MRQSEQVGRLFPSLAVEVDVVQDGADVTDVCPHCMQPMKAADSNSLPQCREIIEYLNTKTGKKFRGVQSDLKRIKARIRDGFTVDDFKAVIDKKVSDWGADSKMCVYLRPETLFGAKFDGYLQETIKKGVVYGNGGGSREFGDKNYRKGKF